MDTDFIGKLLSRKGALEEELAAIDLLLELYQGCGREKLKAATAKKRGGHVALPKGERCAIVISIASELHDKLQKPVTIDEVKQELNKRGYRVPQNGEGYSLLSAYLTAGKKMKREGEGYVPV